MFRCRLRSISLVTALGVASAFSQSQASDARLEGVAVDSAGAAVANVTVSVLNVNTGAQRTILSRENGTFRFPVLPLGEYKIVAESKGFKRFERAGITLSTGQTATI